MGFQNLNPTKKFRISLALGLFISVALLYQNCAPSGNTGATVVGTSTLDPIPAGLAISPSSTTVMANTQLQIFASGGTAPYTYTITGGAGQVSPDGIFSAPGANDTDYIQVKDSAGTIVYSTIFVDAQ
jgi:hypothetical protein